MTDFASRPPTSDFAYGQLPDSEKRRLCRDLLSEFGISKINERGTELIVSCPLPFGLHKHGDRNPSARLSWAKLCFQCDVCGGGGLLWFIGVMRGISGTDARSWLGKRSGVGEVQDVGALLQFFDALYEEGTKEPMPKMNPKVLDSWKFIHPYLTEIRHIPAETIVKFSVGWDPQADRIIIPHFWRDELVGWQSRRLANDGSPKYRSTSGMPRAQTIYNYDGGSDEVIVVESPMSVLSKVHVTPGIEATFGASVSQGQIRLLGAHKKVLLFFDNDSAGWKATEKVGEALMAYCDVSVANNPWAADPADMGESQYLQCLDQSIPWVLWTKPAMVNVLPQEVHS